jgi:hypothetical protein
LDRQRQHWTADRPIFQVEILQSPCYLTIRRS